MKTTCFALAVIGILAAASPAAARSSAPSLAPGGRTIAGPGRNTLAATTGQSVYTDPAADDDVCTTVINSSRSTPVRITMVDESDVETQLEVAAATLAALCGDDVARIDVNCLGPDSCTTQWRVDSK
jgi:hypothetical protein